MPSTDADQPLRIPTMNRGQRHANLLAEYVADREAALQEARERAEEEGWYDDYLCDPFDFDDGWHDAYDEWQDEDERDDRRASYYDDWMDDPFDDWAGVESLIHAPLVETEAQRYERLWREVGY
jgi:hypothetical protein